MWQIVFTKGGHNCISQFCVFFSLVTMSLCHQRVESFHFLESEWVLWLFWPRIFGRRKFRFQVLLLFHLTSFVSCLLEADHYIRNVITLKSLCCEKSKGKWRSPGGCDIKCRGKRAPRKRPKNTKWRSHFENVSSSPSCPSCYVNQISCPLVPFPISAP